MRRLFSAALAVALVAAVAAPATALASTYVIDEANVLPADVVQRIDELSARLEAATPGAEVAVVTIPTLGDKTIEEYAEARFEQLGIGSKDKNNGVLLLVAMKERRVRIEVGYGLEGALPDARAGDIIDTDILPRFKAGDIPGGIEAGHARIVGIVADEYKIQVEGAPAPTTPTGSNSAMFWGLFIGFIVLVAIFTAMRGKSSGGGWTSGGGFGGGGGGFGGGGGGGFGGGGGGGFGGGDSGGGGASGGW